MPEQYGIEQFRDVVKAVVALFNAVDKTTEDGFQLTDIFEFVKPISMIPAAIAGSSEIWNELSDYSEDERLLVQGDIEELEFSSEYAEAIAEQAVRTAVEVATLLTVVRMARKDEPIEKLLDFVNNVIHNKRFGIE